MHFSLQKTSNCCLLDDPGDTILMKRLAGEMAGAESGVAGGLAYLAFRSCFCLESATDMGSPGMVQTTNPGVRNFFSVGKNGFTVRDSHYPIWI